MDLKAVEFMYTGTLKSEQGAKFGAHELLPNLSEITLQSRTFETFAECFKSCSQLFTDVLKDVNASVGDRTFRIAIETNPAHGGTGAVSKDWTPPEISRFWLFDKAMEGTNHIAAIGRGVILAVPKTAALLN